MNLAVGITEWLPQWRIILDQLGLPAALVDLHQSVQPDRYGAIIVTGRLGEEDRSNLLNYLTGGGAILVEADVGEWLLGTGTFPSFVKYVDPVDDPLYHQVVPGSVDARLLLPSLGTRLNSDSLKPLVRIVTRGDGIALVLPGLFSRVILDSRSRRRNFPSPGPGLPSERVARPSKGTFRSIIEQSLEHLFFHRGLPMVSLWPFPNGESTLFAFRVDTDFASGQEVEALAAICQQHDIPATWFLETASGGEYLEEIAGLERQEIGVHCARHRVFRDYVKNERNIFQALGVLSREGIRPHGYAAPFGLWNAALAMAVEHHGFTYSSEFTLDYDDAPFYPYLEDRFSTVLEVPIHPITTGHLRNAHHSDDDMKQYWRHRIEEHQKYRLPLMVYDHPSQANLKVLNWLFREIRQRKIPILPILDYARWWIQKTSVAWRVKLEDDTLRIHSTSEDSSLWLSIRKSPGEQARIRINKSISLKGLQWEKVDPGPLKRTPMALLRTVNRKMIVNDILNRYWRLRSARRGYQESSGGRGQRQG
ncbi:MAG: hypothetical protein ACE5HZ_02915, partial [Fidelibacterota bacterium]